VSESQFTLIQLVAVSGALREAGGQWDSVSTRHRAWSLGGDRSLSSSVLFCGENGKTLPPITKVHFLKRTALNKLKVLSTQVVYPL